MQSVQWAQPNLTVHEAEVSAVWVEPRRRAWHERATPRAGALSS
ncbi:Hypothetical protein AA314_04600 [Archangium gephyra]|uniref:Uncharacterized protein n=1 Tax=Archangium gephyra TaxID=48 RepID=A0AAC8Q8U8_9BACT|nr:Hypothetical protein AA314_04600 [Archangium gephyra]